MFGQTNVPSYLASICDMSFKFQHYRSLQICFKNILLKPSDFNPSFALIDVAAAKNVFFWNLPLANPFRSLVCAGNRCN